MVLKCCQAIDLLDQKRLEARSANGSTALILAAEHNHLEMVNLLLEYIEELQQGRTDVTARQEIHEKNVNATNYAGYSGLCAAFYQRAEPGTKEAFHYVRYSGVGSSVGTYGLGSWWGALWEAWTGPVTEPNKKVANRLLEAGADSNSAVAWAESKGSACS